MSASPRKEARGRQPRLAEWPAGGACGALNSTGARPVDLLRPGKRRLATVPARSAGICCGTDRAIEDGPRPSLPAMSRQAPTRAGLGGGTPRQPGGGLSHPGGTAEAVAGGRLGKCSPCAGRCGGLFYDGPLVSGRTNPQALRSPGRRADLADMLIILLRVQQHKLRGPPITNIGS